VVGMLFPYFAEFERLRPEVGINSKTVAKWKKRSSVTLELFENRLWWTEATRAQRQIEAAKAGRRRRRPLVNAATMP